jgi:hypothetical protein
MLIAIEIVGFLFMLTFMFIGIWGFVLMKQIIGQMRYRNYLLEKMTQNVHMLATKDKNEEMIKQKQTS